MVTKAASIRRHYGFSRLDIMRTAVYFPEIPLALKPCFSNYYLLYWGGDYLRKRIIEGRGTLTRDGIVYNVSYEKGLTPSMIQGKAQFKLSFRKPKPEFELPGIVYISVSTKEK